MCNVITPIKEDNGLSRQINAPGEGGSAEYDCYLPVSEGIFHLSPFFRTKVSVMKANPPPQVFSKCFLIARWF